MASLHARSAESFRSSPRLKQFAAREVDRQYSMDRLRAQFAELTAERGRQSEALSAAPPAAEVDAARVAKTRSELASAHEAQQKLN